jgi:hypothetical protein
MKRYIPYLLLIISIAVFISNSLQKLPYSPDDTFIYMQYARNIASVGGFSFNYGEPSYGVTSPLWVLILSLFYLIGLDGFLFSKILDFLSAFVAVFFFLKICRVIYKDEEKKLLTYLSASIFILNIWFIRWSCTGMETNLALLFTLMILYYYIRNKFKTVFLLSGFLIFIRPECSLLVVIICILLLTRRKNLHLRYGSFLMFLMLFGIIIIPFFVFFYFSFGTIMPNTLLGKSTLTFSLSTIVYQLKAIISTITPASVLEIMLSIVLLLYLIKNKRLKEYLIFFVWPVSLVLLYVITDADIISRYFITILPMFTFLGVKMIDLSRNRKYIFGILLFIIILFQSQILFYMYIKPRTDDFAEGVQECFIPIGRWFNTNTMPGTRILVNDVGAIGYYSQRYIIDAAALVNRDLTLNKKIMQTPVEERTNTVNLLKFIDADYLVERDTIPVNNLYKIDNYRLDFLFEKKFPSLGIADERPKYYKVYKITRK